MAERQERTAGPIRTRLRHLPVSLAGTGAAAAGAAAVGAGVAGGAGAVGACAGVMLVIVSYVVSSLAIAWADSVNPRLVFPVGMAAYVTKFSVFGAAMIAVLNSGWAGMAALGWGIVAGVVAWTGTQIWWVSTKGKPSPGIGPTGAPTSG